MDILENELTTFLERFVGDNLQIKAAVVFSKNKMLALRCANRCSITEVILYLLALSFKVRMIDSKEIQIQSFWMIYKVFGSKRLVCFVETEDKESAIRATENVIAELENWFENYSTS